MHFLSVFFHWEENLINLKRWKVNSSQETANAKLSFLKNIFLHQIQGFEITHPAGTVYLVKILEHERVRNRFSFSHLCTRKYYLFLHAGIKRTKLEM